MSINKIVSLVGARPQLIKEAILGNAVRSCNAWEHVLVHSGQHYDDSMSDIFFDELGIPTPQYHLGIGSGSHAHMTGKALMATEDVLQKEHPDALIVYGDTNTTLAGALAAAKMEIPVIHVEAGIRMLPKKMPEEQNRVLTDHISDVLACCSELGKRNLMVEGITSGVFICGDIMYDIFLRMQHRFTPVETCAQFGVSPGEFILATLHRNYNVDAPDSLEQLLQELISVQYAYGMPVLIPLHPRSRSHLKKWNLEPLAARLRAVNPIGYIDLMSLLCASRFVITDSGGLQKEAYYAGRRALLVMPDTGWRELTNNGWNVLVSPNGIMEGVERVCIPLAYEDSVYGDGNACQSIIHGISQFFS